MKTTTEYFKYTNLQKVYLEEETSNKDTMTFKKIIQQNKKTREYIDIWDMVDPKGK